MARWSWAGEVPSPSGVTRLRNLRPRRRRGKVALFQDVAMVQLVSGDDKCQGTYTDFFLVSGAPSCPIASTQVAKKGERCGAHAFEFLDQVLKAEIEKWAVADVVILFETREGRPIVARDAQGAIGHDAFGVNQMAHDFLHRPLVGRVAQAAIFLAASGEQGNRFRELLFERPEKVVTGNQRDVAVVVGIVFARFRTFQSDRAGGHGSLPSRS